MRLGFDHGDSTYDLFLVVWFMAVDMYQVNSRRIELR
jgi:hypothetical protein